MARVSRKGAIAGLAVAGVLGVGIAVPALAAAANAEPSPSASASVSPKDTAKKTWEQRRDERQSSLAEALAAELGVDKEKVAAALEKVHEKMRAEAKDRVKERGRPDTEQRKARLSEHLDKAVEDGKLTREQADAFLKVIESGVLPGPGWGSGHGPR